VRELVTWRVFAEEGKETLLHIEGIVRELECVLAACLNEWTEQTRKRLNQ